MKQSIRVDSSMIDNDSESYSVGMSKNAIPDVDVMVKTLDKLIDYIESPRMKKLEETDKKKFESLVYGKYNSVLPMKMIGLLIEDERYENLAKLLDMLETLSQIKKGKKDIAEESKKFSEACNEKYMYPQFGGKENFEKMMSEKK